MDVIKVADHLIDLGPEGGDGGGEILFEGTPEKMLDVKRSFTAKFLKEELKDNSKMNALKLKTNGQV
jgi:excinuclease ABC subunit A